MLPLVLSRFRQRFPRTRLVIKEVDSIELLRGIERGDFHVGLMRPPSNSNLVRFRHLLSERFVAVMPRQSALARKPALRLSDFAGHGVFALKRFRLSCFETVYEQLVGAGLRSKRHSGLRHQYSSGGDCRRGITFLPGGCLRWPPTALLRSCGTICPSKFRWPWAGIRIARLQGYCLSSSLRRWLRKT
ncbi:LysR substrate-binding domain-containing protein [Agrobacterium tumefaciens]|uniref:LysR substrate-binding domain-containing protein n=1 Tax=Agrobacterium tumefaciens TaxID=358 RepID=UPI0021D10E30|nr:LysR substrate-binding domain-containing protein [Agrobacterium tumefaciens]